MHAPPIYTLTIWNYQHNDLDYFCNIASKVLMLRIKIRIIYPMAYYKKYMISQDAILNKWYAVQMHNSQMQGTWLQKIRIQTWLYGKTHVIAGMDLRCCDYKPRETKASLRTRENHQRHDSFYPQNFEKK